MARLAGATPRDWVPRIEERPLALLSDHAHCEMRAAASAQSLVARHPARAALVQALCVVACEELEHFARVMALLARRGGRLQPAVANPYAEGLLRLCRDQGEARLLDRLLVSALIERRSLERFQLLAQHLADPELAALYRDLAPSEARHHARFVELARAELPEADVDGRLAELAAREAELIAGLPFDWRMHSGWGAVAEASHA